MNEDKLQKLKPIRIDEVEKQKDFEKIEQRLHKKPFYWQVPAVAFSMVLLVLFLVATITFPTNDQMNLSSDPTLTAILFHEGKADPKSMYYLGVEKSVDLDELQLMQSLLDELQPMDTPSTLAKAHRTYRFQYSNDEYIVLTEYMNGHQYYLKDVNSNMYYKLEDGNRFFYLKNTKPQIWQYGLFAIIFLLLFGGNWYIDKQMRVPGDAKRKLPMHSNYTQSIAMVCYIFILFFAFAGGIGGNTNIHVVWLYVIGLLFATVNILIEQKHDNNAWRKLRFVNTGLLLPTYLFLFLQLL